MLMLIVNAYAINSLDPETKQSSRQYKDRLDQRRARVWGLMCVNGVLRKINFLICVSRKVHPLLLVVRLSRKRVLQHAVLETAPL